MTTNKCSKGILGSPTLGKCSRHMRRHLSTMCFILMVVSLILLFLQSTQDHAYRYFSNSKWIMANESKNSFRLSSSQNLHPSNVIPQAAGNSQKQLLLVTYGRSGSSFTSELISHDTSVFYAFEPLYVLQRLQTSAQKSHRKLTFNVTSTSIEILRSFLSCDFNALNTSYFDNIQLRLSGPEMKQFYACCKTVTHGIRHIQCFLKMMKECQKKSTVFAKVIRLPLSWAEELLRDMPNLKILYLVRDPRAVIHSQATVFRSFKWPQDVQKVATNHCKLLTEDLAAMEKISSRFPDRIKVIRYESGASDPTNYTTDIYKFVQLNFTNQTLAHIKSVTNAKNDSHNPYSLVKSSPMKSANKWRSKVKYDAVKLIDNACANIYSKYGYMPVTSQGHLQSNKSLFEPTFDQRPWKK